MAGSIDDGGGAVHAIGDVYPGGMGAAEFRFAGSAVGSCRYRRRVDDFGGIADHRHRADFPDGSEDEGGAGVDCLIDEI